MKGWRSNVTAPEGGTPTTPAPTSGALGFHRHVRRLALFFMTMALAVIANQYLIHAIWPDEFLPPHRLATSRLEPRNQGGDSWWPMIMAVMHLEENKEPPVYEAIFFSGHAKFQYPLSSLHPVAAAATKFPEDWDRSVDRHEYYKYLHESLYKYLNRISFYFYLSALASTGVLLLWGMSGLAERRGETLARRDRIALVILGILFAFIYYPLLKGYTQGQVQTWINAFFAFSLLAWMRRREGISGALIGLACLFKPQLGLVLIWSLLRRRWNFAACFLAVFGSGMAISVCCYGLENHLGYLKVLSYISHTGEGYYANQSLNGLMNRMLGNGNNLDWLYFSFAPYHPVVYWTTTLTGLALAGAAMFWRIRSPKPASILEYGIMSLTAVVISPVAWEQHYGVLAPLFAVALPPILQFRPFGRATLPALMVSFTLTALFLQFTNLWANTPFNFVQSYLYLGALLFLALLYRTAWVEKSELERK
jgi:alpha-1,2-mannosyltransferase